MFSKQRGTNVIMKTFTEIVLNQPLEAKLHKMHISFKLKMKKRIENLRVKKNYIVQLLIK